MPIFEVEGMTCEHCVRAVTGAVRQVDPGAEVDISLQAGRVDLKSGAPVEKLAEAIRAERYQVRPLAACAAPIVSRSRKPMHRTVTAALLFACLLAAPAFAADSISGTYALPEGRAKVSATLATTPGQGLRRTLDIAMTPIGGTAPVRQYETELSKQLHVIAVSADLRDFVHEHGDKPAFDGHFRVTMPFPHAGLWHVYADGVPQGLGQQVFRFEVPIDAGMSEAASPALQPSGLESSEGRYGGRFDAFDLKAGQKTQLALHLLRDGKPAPDVTPFLGVAAHAVFIDAADLSYVHVHAAPAQAPTAGGTGAVMAHDMTGMKDMPGMASTAKGNKEGMGPPLAPGSRIPSDLTLHVQAPKAATYVLWIQFTGGDKVRTMRFVVPVAG